MTNHQTSVTSVYFDLNLNAINQTRLFDPPDQTL